MVELPEYGQPGEFIRSSCAVNLIVAGLGMTEIWLVRHGQTDWNLEGRLQGQLDVPLNDTGLEQAKKLAATCRRKNQCDFASDLMRARQTAEIISPRSIFY